MKTLSHIRNFRLELTLSQERLCPLPGEVDLPPSGEGNFSTQEREFER